MSEQVNNDFGIPGPAGTATVPPPVAAVTVGETPEQRMARLQALADIAIGQESDAEIVERLVAEARAARAAKLLPTDTAGFPADYDRIVIYPGRDENDLSYVPLSINGFCIKAPRDVEIILPHIFVTECLDHAVETKVTQAKDRSGQLTGGLILRSAHRFPYQFKGKATPEEYKAYQQSQRAQFEHEMMAAA